MANYMYDEDCNDIIKTSKLPDSVYAFWKPALVTVDLSEREIINVLPQNGSLYSDQSINRNYKNSSHNNCDVSTQPTSNKPIPTTASRYLPGLQAFNEPLYVPNKSNNFPEYYTNENLFEFGSFSGNTLADIHRLNDNVRNRSFPLQSDSSNLSYSSNQLRVDEFQTHSNLIVPSCRNVKDSNKHSQINKRKHDVLQNHNSNSNIQQNKFEDHGNEMFVEAETEIPVRSYNPTNGTLYTFQNISSPIDQIYGRPDIAPAIKNEKKTYSQVVQRCVPDKPPPLFRQCKDRQLLKPEENTQTVRSQFIIKQPKPNIRNAPTTFVQAQLPSTASLPRKSTRSQKVPMVTPPSAKPSIRKASRIENIYERIETLDNDTCLNDDRPFINIAENGPPDNSVVLSKTPHHPTSHSPKRSKQTKPHKSQLLWLQVTSFLRYIMSLIPFQPMLPFCVVHKTVKDLVASINNFRGQLSGYLAQNKPAKKIVMCKPKKRWIRTKNRDIRKNVYL